jgi:hypothetical protein
LLVSSSCGVKWAAAAALLPLLRCAGRKLCAFGWVGSVVGLCVAVDSAEVSAVAAEHGMMLLSLTVRSRAKEACRYLHIEMHY